MKKLFILLIFSLNVCNGQWVRPVNNFPNTGQYRSFGTQLCYKDVNGNRICLNKWHNAFDIPLSDNTVRAIMDGEVIISTTQCGYATENVNGKCNAIDGEVVVISHTNSNNQIFYTQYAHFKRCEKIKTQNVKVKAGEIIGYVYPYYCSFNSCKTPGTDISNVAHLHFGINTTSATTGGYTDYDPTTTTEPWVNPTDYLQNNCGTEYLPLNFNQTINAGKTESPQQITIIFNNNSGKNLSTNPIQQLKIGNTNVNVASVGAIQSLGDNYHLFTISLPANTWTNNQNYDIQFNINFTDNTSIQGYGKNQVRFSDGEFSDDNSFWYEKYAKYAARYGFIAGVQRGTTSTYDFGNANGLITYGTAARLAVMAGIRTRIKAGTANANLAGSFAQIVNNDFKCHADYPYLQMLKNWGYNLPANATPDADVRVVDFISMLTTAFQMPAQATPTPLKSRIRVASTPDLTLKIGQDLVVKKADNSIEALATFCRSLAEVSCVTDANLGVNKALMVKLLVNFFEHRYSAINNNNLPNARVAAADYSDYSIIGDKFELTPNPYGSQIPPQTLTPKTLVSGQIKDFPFPDVTIGGLPVHVYWSIDGGTLAPIGSAPLFQSVKFTAPTVSSQTTYHLYYYAATSGGYAQEFFQDIIVNPSGTPPPSAGISIQTASSKDFGNIDVGQFGDEIITVTNPSTSTGSLVGSISAPTGVDMSISPLTTNGLTFNLAPGQSKLFYIRFEPQSAGTYTNSLNISHNATNVTNPMSVSLTGVGISNTVAQSLNCSGAGTIACGSVTNGTTSGGANNAQFYCSTPKLMTGPEKIYSFTPSITNEYFVKFTDNTGGNLALFILGTCNISAGCNAIVSGVGSTIERVFFNAGTTYYFVVDGENSVAGDFSIELVNGCPIQYYTPSGGTAGCLRMGILNVLGNANMNIGYIEGNGSSYQRTFILKNEANTYVNCNLSFSGRDAAIFSVFEGTNISLQPYETKTLTLIFTPPASSDIKAYLDITHNAACTPLRMQINGTTVPTFTWTRPTGGETFYNCAQWLASSNTVSWTKNIPGGTASIEVSLDGGITWQPYFTSGSCGWGSGSSEVDNDGSDWFNANGFCTTKGKMRIKMIGASDPWTESPGYFTIRDDATTQALYVKYPNGAEIFEGASWVNVQWNNANNETVTLKYSTDGGNSWITIGTGITGTSYNWKVPYLAQNQTNCKIGVFGSSSTDYSDCAFTIFAKTAPSLTYTQNVVNPPCNNSATGSASVSVTAGVGPYTYSWKKDGSSISGSSNSQSNLAKGSYEVTINDAGGNQIKTATFGLYCTPFTITATTTSATCTKNNGSASISISPTGNYSYTWNTGETSSSINNKVSGTYSLTVTNITTGCSQTQDVYIPSILSPVNVSISTAPTLCQGTTTNITATPTGGTAPYAYAWSNGGNTQTVALGAGNYQSVVTDANGCQGSSNVIINGYTQTIGGVLSPQSQTICQNVGSVNTLLPEVFTLSGYTGNILRWEYKTPAGVWTNWNLAGSTTSGNCCFGTAIGNWKVRAVVRDAANNCPEAYSAEGDVIVMSTPTAILSGTQTINVGQTATLTVNFTGSAPWSFVLNGQTYSDILTSPYTLTITPTATNTYTLTSMTGECGTGTVSGSAIVTVNTTCTQMYTLKTGNWNDVTVWSCGRVPTSTDIITIKANHIITIPASYTANTKDVNYETGGKISPAANTSKLCLNCPPIPTNGLIGYYPLNGNANDASGNGLNGSIVGSITSITDRKGIANSAYQFSGVVLNYISIPDNALLCSNIITLNAWVNFAPSEGGYIINKGRDIQNGSFRLYTGGVAGQVLYNGVNDASYASVPTNQWVMVTGIINGNNAKYYVNGVMVSQATLSSSYVCSSAGNPLTIGNHYYNGVPNVWAYPYKGKIDDVRIYNRALLDAEVLQIYNAEKP